MPGRGVSISLRLTMWFGATLLGGWLLFGAAMWLNLRHALRNERRQTLERRVERLEELLRRDAEGGYGQGYEDYRHFAAATGNGLVELFRGPGELYWPSPSPAAAAFPWPAGSGDGTERFTHLAVNGQPYWVMERRFALGQTPVTIAAAAPEAGNVALLNGFRSSLTMSAPVLLLISMAGGYWMSRRALRPVDAITAAARSISIRNLSERVPETGSSDELGRLAATCNDMLTRLEEAVRKLKQFTADASHELRGPLTVTRTIAEVALLNPRVDDESRDSLKEIVAEAERASVLLEEMLELARADAEPVHVALEPVDVSDVVTTVCGGVEALAARGQLTMNVRTEPGRVLGHAPSLRRLVYIVLDNAVKYTPAGGRIEVSVSRREDAVTVLVADTGVGIAAEHLPRIFDRFYRADASRSLTEGTGLGLAIAKWIADVHRARIDVESRDGAGTAVRLTFPCEDVAVSGPR